jgi:hypothetical protein
MKPKKNFWAPSPLVAVLALLILMALTTTPSIGAQSIIEHENDTTTHIGEKEDQFRFVNVTLIVRDMDGIPIKDAQVKAFSEDWGIRYPEFWFSYSDSDGVVTYRLPVGNWSFFAGGGSTYSQKHPGYGYFAILKYVQIMNNCTLTIQPNDEIIFSIFDIYNQPLNAEVRAMDSDHVPIVVAPSVGLCARASP